MTVYAAPVADLAFALDRLVGPERLAALPAHQGLDRETIEAVLEQAGRFASEVIAPLNPVGDRHGARLANGIVTTPPGWKAAWDAFVAQGWNAVPFDPAHGGQGLPWALQMALNELWQGASIAFGLCPLLTAGAVEALQQHGTPEQQALYLPRLISGQWTGTMNLTEPQAGSDLSTVKARALPEGDGSYRIFGQKIYITYGEHDLSENIIHLVLARLPDAPAGTAGISLFLVPKYLVNADGSLGPRNDVRCVSLEHKLGIHASPTAVMAYGDDGGARGWLVGLPNRGLNAMFTMMNNARLGVGVQGIGLAERATQQARAYAAERVQGRGPDGRPTTIAGHPDVRRMLLTMRVLTEGGRGLALLAGLALDEAHGHPEPAVRAAAKARVDLLTPIVKGWCTEQAVQVASLGVQVHGGMGFVEDTGAAQHYRDARILPIYEGTNGIQAADLVTRKLQRDGGAAMGVLLAEMRETARALAAPQTGMPAAARSFTDALGWLEQATAQAIAAGPDSVRTGALATPYLRLVGLVACGWVLAREALALDAATDPTFARQKRVTARFALEQLLPEAQGFLAAIAADPAPLMELAAAEL